MIPPPRTRLSRRIGNRMGCFNHFNLLAIDLVSISRDDEALEVATPIILNRSRHFRRRLSGADDNSPSLGRIR